MSYSIPYADGQILKSSALSPVDAGTIFQLITLQALGITVNSTNPDAAYRQVRVGWQQDGAPAWKINEDVCVITAYPQNDPFAQVRDMLYNQNDDISLVQQMSYTQVWKIHWMFQGPNCFTNASAVITAMQLDWVREFLQYPPAPYVAQLFLIPVFNRPIYIPNDFQGRWWQMATLELKFNELVLENIVIPAAYSANITVVTDVKTSEQVPEVVA